MVRMDTVAIPEHGPPGKVLVVDDDAMMADLVAEWVAEKWACEVRYSGPDAFDAMDASFDVLVSDRSMPELSGDDLARAVRDAGMTIPILLVSGDRPDFGVLDVPFNDYLVKPVDRPEVQAAIEELFLRRSYREPVQRFLDLVARLDVLETELPREALLGNDEYLGLKAKADELRQSVPATLGEPTRPLARMMDYNADD